MAHDSPLCSKMEKGRFCSASHGPHLQKAESLLCSGHQCWGTPALPLRPPSEPWGPSRVLLPWWTCVSLLELLVAKPHTGTSAVDL